MSDRPPDGRYGATITSAKLDNDGGLVLELTVNGGDYDGQVLPARSAKQRFGKEPEELLARPVDLTIRYGVLDISLAE
jgi:hypothetical protein